MEQVILRNGHRKLINNDFKNSYSLLWPALLSNNNFATGYTKSPAFLLPVHDVKEILGKIQEVINQEKEKRRIAPENQFSRKEVIDGEVIYVSLADEQDVNFIRSIFLRDFFLTAQKYNTGIEVSIDNNYTQENAIGNTD